METLDLGLSNSPENNEELEVTKSIIDPQAFHQKYNQSQTRPDSHTHSDSQQVSSESACKRQRLENEGNVEEEKEEGDGDQAILNEDEVRERRRLNRIKNRPRSAVNGTYSMQVARPLQSMKGHTAFLTFAVAPIKVATTSSSSIESK